MKKFGFKHFVFAVVLFSLLVIIIMPGSNLIQYFIARSQIRADQKQIRELNAEIEQIDAKINQLKSNPDSLEKFAREQFQFAEPGDDVYIIEE